MIQPMLAAVLVLVLGLALRPTVPPRRFGAERAGVPGAHSAPNRSRTRTRTRRGMWRRHSVLDAADLAAWCDTLARAVRGRATLNDAVRSQRATPDIELHLAPVRLAVERGTPLADALAVATGTDPNLDMVLVVLRTCATHGGPAAQPIDRVAAALRQRAALAAERRSHSAQARLSAHVMTALPGALLAVLVTSSSSVRSAIRSPLGVTVLLAGVALNGLGWWWMRRMIEAAGR
jgi:tight adherence protein B